MTWNKLNNEYKTQFISDLQGLIAIESVKDITTASPAAPFGENVQKAMDYMKELGLREGFKVKEYDGYALVLEFGEGEESIGVLGHLDVVPLGEGWTKNPLEGQIIDGYMFGRGVIDDKGPSIAGFYAVKLIKEYATKMKRRILLIFGSDEESGMECMDYYVKHGEIPTMGIVPDADFPVVYGEKGILRINLSGAYEGAILEMEAGSRPNIVIGKANALVKTMSAEQLATFEFYLKSQNLVGSYQEENGNHRLFIEGVFSHAAWPYNGTNAAMHLLNFVGSCLNDEVAYKIAQIFTNWQGKDANIMYEGAYMGFLTMNPGIVNIKDGEVLVTLDIRYPNDTNLENIETGIQKALTDHELNLVMETKEHMQPLFMNPNSEFIQTLEKAYREVSKDDFTPLKTMGGGTYARKLPNCVAFGPEFPTSKLETKEFVGGPHQKDEGMKLEDLYNAVEIYANVLKELCVEE